MGISEYEFRKLMEQVAEIQTSVCKDGKCLTEEALISSCKNCPSCCSAVKKVAEIAEEEDWADVEDSDELDD
jgi:hypothetical protein